VCAPCAPFFLPCFWIHAAILSPCLCGYYCYAKGTYGRERFALTTERVYMWKANDARGAKHVELFDCGAISKSGTGPMVCCKAEMLLMEVPQETVSNFVRTEKRSRSYFLRTVTVDNETVEKMLEEGRKRYHARPNVEASAPVIAEDPTETLRKLMNLNKQGLITDEELKVKKAEVLKRI